MGHPLGATGAMILGTVLDELERRNLNTALVTLCIGVGMGTADAPPVQGLHLVVDDVDAARELLRSNDVDVSEVSDMGGGVRYAYFSDPDGNSWALQETRR